MSSSRPKPWLTSSRCNCAAALHSKNGTSLNTSTAIRPKPQGSWVVNHAGGALLPVNQGDRRRATHPLGATRAIRPTANATCGTAKSGPKQRTSFCHRAPGKFCDKTKAVTSKEIPVAATPVQRVVKIAPRSCRWEPSSCHAAASAPATAAETNAPPIGNTTIANKPKLAKCRWVICRCLGETACRGQHGANQWPKFGGCGLMTIAAAQIAPAPTSFVRTKSTKAMPKSGHCQRNLARC